MSKGDSRRPSSVPKEIVDANYEAVFGEKKLNVCKHPYLQKHPDWNQCPRCGWCKDGNYGLQEQDPPANEDRGPSGEVPTDGYESRDLHVPEENPNTEGTTVSEPCTMCGGYLGHGSHGKYCFPG